MPRRRTLSLESVAVASRLDVAIEGVLYALLAFLPLAFGAVEAWSELVLYVGCTVLALLAVYRAVQTGAWRLGSKAAWVVAVCAAGLPAYAAVQSAVLPRGVVAAVAPANAAAYDEHLSDLDEPPREMAVSLDRGATARRARLLLAAATLLGVVMVGFRDRESIRRLLLAVFVIGMAEAALGLAQIFTFATQIYWTYGSPGGRVVTAGSFVNYSHFAQFVNLSIGCGLALWLVRMKNSASGAAGGAGTSLQFASSSQWAQWQAALAPHAWLIVGLTVCGLAVLMSMSRNGALSLMMATAVAGTLMWRRGTVSWRGWALGAVPALLFAVLLVTAFDTVYERLATLEDNRYVASRWELTLGALRAWQAFPLWGVGCDAHAVVFPLFDTAVLASLAENADNDWAQWLEELGLAGGALLVGLIVGTTVLAMRLMMRGRRSASRAAFGLTLGLTAVAIHSATDFGQRVPAVFALTAVAMGLLVALDRLERRRGGAAAVDLTGAQVWLRAAPAWIVVAGAWGAALWGGYRAYAAENWRWVAIGLEEKIAADPELATDADYGDLLAAAEEAVAWAPADVQYGYQLNVTRWQALQGAFFQDDGAAPEPEAADAARQIAADLQRVRSLAPTYGPPVALEGQVRLFALNDPQGAELIRRAAPMAPYDPITTYLAGALAAQDGKADAAHTLLDRAVQLSPRYFEDVAWLYLTELDRAEWAGELAGDDPGRLDQLARLAESLPGREEFAAEVRGRVESALRRRADGDKATASELAALARIDAAAGEVASAETLYRRALGLDYGQYRWRLELAKFLAEQGRYDDALREARIVLRLRPHDQQTLRLVDEWTVAAAAAPVETDSPGE